MKAIERDSRKNHQLKEGGKNVVLLLLLFVVCCANVIIRFDKGKLKV